jgi:hypothetical protein
MSILTAFGVQVINLCTELTNMYPEDSFFKSGLTAASLMKKTNPRLMHNLIMEKMSDYRDQIFNEDDDFFANEINKIENNKKTESNTEIEKDTKVDILNRHSDEDNFNFILRVRTYWDEMSPNTKNQIWMYLKVLFKLSDRLN